MKLAKITKDQVPDHLKGKWGAFFQWLGKLVIGSSGWKIKGKIPHEERILIIAAPHTSNWDFILGISALFALLGVFTLQICGTCNPSLGGPRAM